VPNQETSQDEKNRALIAALRESFTPQTERLTPEVEPATVYVLESVADDD
jgi:hypothetical protein